MAGVPYHYHAVMKCGHQIGIDLNTDLFARAAEYYADPQIEIPCRVCAKSSTSVELKLIGQVLVCECGKGQRR